MYGIPDNVDWTFLIGQEVLQICIGSNQVQVNCDDVSISIESNYAHVSKQGMVFEQCDGMPRQSVTLISLLQSKVSSVVRENCKTLALHFSNGETLRLFDDNPQYECFQIATRDRFIVV